MSRLQREKPRPRPNIGRWAGKCDQCKADCFEDHLGDVICSECGLIKDDPGRILEHPIKWDNGRTPAIGGSEWVAISGDLDYRTLPGYGLRKPREERSFPGEANLTTPGKGSAATTREDKQIRHFCGKHGSYLARPIWWTNPNNGNEKCWFCLKCQKAAGVVDYPPKWEDGDWATLGALESEERKTKRLTEGSTGTLYPIVSRYLNTRRKDSEDQIDPDTKNSLYHYQKRLPANRYLKTAVLTVLWLRAAGKYARLAAATIRPKPKGGRRPNGGARAISNWCARCRFTKEIPIKEHRADENNLQYGLILESFDDQKIEPILKELDERNIKYCFRHLKSIADIGV